MDLEFSTLDNKMSAWDIVDRTKDMKVLGSIWAFRCKLFPDGMVRKLKARFCVRGDQQVEGIDFFELFPPVVPVGSKEEVVCICYPAGKERSHRG